ncbi:NUDIX domain-containing protein [Acuticoccus sp. M5D2P5]|uniref:NUDIX domain-containing protein n=1 Tax=Acuticoccus kalidii TaxID=2910977 RepID=UPI001F2E340D|nr:NUDIX domain-containing protein [Acuticoccus kalidii]MCF3932980.1 NUDIX domain-containing protein [Acuticoccus kalidii]
MVDKSELLGKVAWRLGALIRPKVTLGVRCVLIDAADRVLLVRHTYLPGWHFPGGGVDPGETTREAAVRELWEETGIAMEAMPEFFGLYWNRALERRDHVAVYVARGHPPIDEAVFKPHAKEIAEVRLAPLSALPDGLTGATRRRLDELVGGAPRAELW